MSHIFKTTNNVENVHQTCYKLKLSAINSANVSVSEIIIYKNNHKTL